MRSSFFTALTFVGLQGAMAIDFSSTHGLGVTPASHETCAVDGLAQVLLEGSPTKAKAAAGPPPKPIKKGSQGEDDDEDEGESDGEGERHAQVASQGETQPPAEEALVKAKGKMEDANKKYKAAQAETDKL